MLRARGARRRMISWCMVASLGIGWVQVGQAQSRMPHLRKQGTATQLIVDGKPFLILGGELGNSTASDLDYLRPSWARFRALHLNTILAPVYWERIEPAEGQFDFSLVDGLIEDARRNGMRLVLLWFGSWKNGMSSYAPGWVKTNQKRFPRTEATRGQGQEILSPFSAANYEADARAFAALMRHLRAVDGDRHTVIMVQVENEIGMIPEARDHSATADSLFAQPVPKELMEYLQRHKQTLDPDLRARWDAQGGRMTGTWEEVFGPGVYTEELFMAWHFARYVEHVAAAGKAEYPLPMFVNAALIRPGYLPGRYPSAGPLPHLLEVWRAGAPSIDFIAPDIYFPNFAEWTGKYVRSGNPLFIPEARLSPQSAVDVLYAIGKHDAIGYSPFAIEGANVADSLLAQSYALLEQLTPLIVEHQGRGTMTGVMPRIAFDGTVDDAPQEVKLEGLEYTITVTFGNPPGPPGGVPGNPGAPGDGLASAAGGPSGAPLQARASPSRPVTPRGGIIIALGPDEFLVAGTGLILTFAPRGPGDPIAGILSAQEGRFVNGRWEGGRWLNGDQTHQGRHISLGPGRFSMQRVRLYRYR